MSGSSLIPEKIKSPIQLMAAWFVMLVSVITVLLTTAVKIEKPEWAAGYLVISSTIIILLVIGCVLLMLTKYRPNLQDGKEYAEWIKDQGIYSKGLIVQPESNFTNISINTKQSSLHITSGISDIRVLVIDIFGCSEIMESLKNKGFNVDRHPFTDNDIDTHDSVISVKGKHEGIWVGSRVEANLAIKAIKVALKTWPDLKYIHIPSDRSDPPDHVNDQIFIGGASSTPIRRGTRPWTYEELIGLKDNMSMQEFHSKIREKYS